MHNPLGALLKRLRLRRLPEDPRNLIRIIPA